MRKLNLTRCKICNKDCNPRGFSQHTQKSHGLSIKEYLEKLTKIQVNNLENDKLKLNLAMSCGYDLLSVYDTELGDFMSNNVLKNIISSRKDATFQVEYSPLG